MTVNRDTALAEIAKIVGPSGIVDPTDAETLLLDERALFRGEAAPDPADYEAV